MHNLMHFNMFETSIIRLYVNEVLYKCGGGGKETKTVFRCLQMSLRVHGIICFSRECMKHFNTFAAAAFVCIQCVCTVYISAIAINSKAT